MAKQKITPYLWYTKDAEEAARFYASVFPESRVDKVNTLKAETPSGPPGSVVMVEFTLFGQQFRAMSAGPHDPFNDAVSFMVQCANQTEIDRYWNAILEHGGKPTACGWINDRYGVRWQIVPAQMDEWLSGDPAAAKRVTEAFLKQVKLDVATLEAAHRGK